MDLESADSNRSRRQLLGAIGAAGIASAAALAVARPAAAAPASPTDADKELLLPAMEAELTARDLYREAAAAGLSDEATALAQEFAATHAAYADGIAGACGFSAVGINEEMFEDHSAEFSGSDDTAFAEAATSLENTLAATHTEQFARFESVQARELASSIVTVEARMATVLVEFAGNASDLDALFHPDAEALEFDGAEA